MTKRPYKILRSGDHATVIITGECNIPVVILEREHLWGYKRCKPFPYKVLEGNPRKTIILRYVKE